MKRLEDGGTTQNILSGHEDILATLAEAEERCPGLLDPELELGADDPEVAPCPDE